jgi:hypothetical protein
MAVTTVTLEVAGLEQQDNLLTDTPSGLVVV